MKLKTLLNHLNNLTAKNPGKIQNEPKIKLIITMTSFDSIKKNYELRISLEKELNWVSQGKELITEIIRKNNEPKQRQNKDIDMVKRKRQKIDNKNLVRK